VVWDVVLPYTRSAVIGGIFLGLGRALGETMAVTFVIGKRYNISASLLEPGTRSPRRRQRIRRGGGPAAQVHAAGAGLPAVRAHLHRARGGGFMLLQLQAPAGPLMHATDRLYLKRRIKDRLAMVLAVARRYSACSGWCGSCGDRQQGHGQPGPDLFTMMTPPPDERGGHPQRAVRQRGDQRACDRHRHADRRAGRHLPRRVRQPHPPGHHDPLHQRHPAVGASIVLGLFVYALVVVPMGHFSPGRRIALAFIALPVIVRTTDEMLRLVPAQMREAALSLGVPQWKVTLQVLYRAALPGIVTGVLLALARISGETAPLLFTAYNNQFWSTDLNAPMANVPMVIFQYAMSPYDSWNSIAWAGAFVVTIFVLLLGLLARAILLRNKVRHD
jgi:phosphate transport system permease protein